MLKHNFAIYASFVIGDSQNNQIDPSILENLHIPGAVVTTHAKPKLASDAMTVLKLVSLCEDNIHLQSHIDWLLNELRYGDVQKLEALCAIHGSMFSCAIYTNRSHIIPSVGLTIEQTRAFVRLNAELDIDILA